MRLLHLPRSGFVRALKQTMQLHFQLIAKYFTTVWLSSAGFVVLCFLFHCEKNAFALPLL